MKKIFFTVTNDLTYDQRMHRICTSLAENGYAVTLVGRKLSTSLQPEENKFNQKRITCWFNKGKLFYTEYNFRLFFFLLFRKMDAVCAIDLDSILPCLYISRLKRIPRIYDAHELFTGLKEVVSRQRVLKVWTKIEKLVVPKFKWGYTVSESIAVEFQKRYNVNYQTIRNLPVLRPKDTITSNEKIILYQGAVNEARGFEQLIPAMKKVNYPLVICGDGNFMEKARILTEENNLGEKIIFKGMLPPPELWKISCKAYIGINLVENDGLNQFYSLANKFFDYIHAELPQITMNFPEYQKINNQYKIALLIDDLNPETISTALNKLVSDTVLYEELRMNCIKAREELNWQNEQKKLLSFYNSIFTT